jgi:glycosyltransferase involved in cell wall biosynthesis
MKRKIIVAHIITRLELGGAQLNTLYTVEHLDPELFSTVLIYGPGGLLDDQAAGRANLFSLAALGREINARRDLRALRGLAALLKKIKPDIVHTHSAKAGVIGRLAARWLRVPVIIHTFHGFSFSPWQPLGQRKAYWLAERMLRPLTSHVIFVSSADMRQAECLGLLGKSSSLIRSGFPLARFRSSPGDKLAFYRQYGVAEDRLVCGVVAPFKPQKGLFHLLDIAARVISRNPRVIFFLAGDGELRPGIEAEIERLRLRDHFILPGFLRQIEKALAGFTIGVSTALWEGLPQSLVQMRLLKIPLVASAIPGNSEVVIDGQNGYLVDVRDHQRFAERILTLAEDAELRRRLANFAGEDFADWEATVMVRQQEELYLSLVAGLPGTQAADPLRNRRVGGKEG